jgi:hypothetical protein
MPRRMEGRLATANYRLRLGAGSMAKWGVVPKAGLYQRGLLKSLMDRAIPFSPLMIAQTVIASLYLSVSVFGSVCHEK